MSCAIPMDERMKPLKPQKSRDVSIPSPQVLEYIGLKQKNSQGSRWMGLVSPRQVEAGMICTPGMGIFLGIISRNPNPGACSGLWGWCQSSPAAPQAPPLRTWIELAGFHPMEY